MDEESSEGAGQLIEGQDEESSEGGCEVAESNEGGGHDIAGDDTLGVCKPGDAREASSDSDSFSNGDSSDSGGGNDAEEQLSKKEQAEAAKKAAAARAAAAAKAKLEAAKERECKAKSKLAEVAAKLKVAKGELSEHKRRFRNWRAKYPEDDLSVRYKATVGGGVNRLKDEQLGILLAEYVTKKSKIGKELEEHSTSSQTSRRADSITREMSYAEACLKFHIDPIAPGASEKLLKYVALGVAKKKR